MSGDTSHRIETPAGSVAWGGAMCEIVRIAAAGGYEAAGRLFEASEGRGAAVYLHGIQSHSGWFVRSCEALRRSGVTVLAADRRGSGLNGVERGHADSAEQLIADVDGAVDWLRHKTGRERVDLVAVSWSGKLALAYAAEHGSKVRSVALVAPGLCAKVDITLKEKIAVGVQGVVQPRKLHRIPLDDPTLFTANPFMIEFIINDPLKLTEATAGFLMASRRLDGVVRKVVGQIAVPVHLFLAEYDRIIDNEATIDLLRPALRPMRGAAAGVKFYFGAHHTLDFEPEPGEFFADLAGVLAE